MNPYLPFSLLPAYTSTPVVHTIIYIVMMASQLLLFPLTPTCFNSSSSMLSETDVPKILFPSSNLYCFQNSAMASYSLSHEIQMPLYTFEGIPQLSPAWTIWCHHRNLCSHGADLCTVSSQYLCLIYVASFLFSPVLFPLRLLVSHPFYRATFNFLEAFFFTVLSALNSSQISQYHSILWNNKKTKHILI